MGILLLGAMVLSPVIAALGLDPVPGDFAVGLGHSHLGVPVTYSLCASMGLTLLYCAMKG
ncbi:MAG TPA: hypothetical protein VN685_01140 [Rhizomicrobium sp.]|nr:hypothetical protein [Rhizomicrobium sp.]